MSDSVVETPAVNPQPAGIGAPGVGGTPSEPVVPAPGSEKAEAGVGAKPETPPVEAEAPAPVSVEYKLTPPEGVSLDEARVTAITEVAKKHGVSPEALTALANEAFSDMKVANERAVADNRKAWEDTQRNWEKEIEADPELGGAAAKNNQILIGRALDEYGSDSARDAFKLTGAGNNPHIVRMFLRMAKALSEGGAVPAGNPKRQPRTAGQLLYGKD